MFFFYLTFNILSYRVTGNVKFYYKAGYICDFGFLKGGEFVMTARNNISKFKEGLSRIFIMTKDQYNSFQNALLNDELDFEKCDYGEVYDKFLINFTDNYDEILFDGKIDMKRVYYTVIMNCDYKLARDEDRYYLDAVFMNPDGQLLDYREIPKLKIFPTFIAIVSIILVLFIGLLIYYKRHFLKLYIFIIVCCLMYILFLVFSFISLKYSSNHDDHSKWEICLTVFECLYCICLCSFLVISSTGWCLLNVELNVKDTIITIFAISAMFSMLFLQVNVEYGYYELLFFFIEIASMFIVARALFNNTKDAEDKITAHLYVISKDGIDPKTTPIYEKYKMYQIFLYMNMFFFLFIIIVNSIMGLFEVESWLQSLINIFCQLFALLNPIIIFRPRGKSIDKYMENDYNKSLLNDDDNNGGGSGIGGDFGDRDEVMLDDLDGFDPRKSQGTEWQDGMKLPLQPILVGKEVSKKPMRKTENTYTTIEEPLNQHYQET